MLVAVLCLALFSGGTTSALSAPPTEGAASPLAVGSPEPTVTLDLPTNAFIGEALTFQATFDNTASSSDPEDNVGYGPFIDLYLPATGIDGDDGIGSSPVTASYLGSALTVVQQTFSDPDGEVTHPYLRDSNGDYLTITGTPGDKLVTILLPYGSFAPDQPPATIDITTNIDAYSDVGAPLTIRSRGGFRFGKTPLNDWCCDSLVLLPATNTATDWPGTDVTPTVLSVSKRNSAPEGETATGPSYPRQYTISVDIADGQTISGLALTDVLPDNIQYLGLISSNPAAGTLTATPSTTTPGGTLTYQFDNDVTGGPGAADATLTFEFYVAYADSGSSDVLNPETGGAVTSINADVTVGGTWNPDDVRDDPATFSTPCEGNCNVLTDRSLSIQKSVSHAPGGDVDASGYTPSDTVEYTLSFEVSDYFAFENLSLTDILSDGQSFILPADDTDLTGPMLTINEHGAQDVATSRIAASSIDVVDEADGSTTITFRLSDELIRRGLDSSLVGGCVPQGGTGGSIPDCDTYNGGSTTGTITFRAQLLEEYKVPPPPDYEPAVDHGDTLNNAISILGSLLNVGDLSPKGTTESDSAGASLTIVRGMLVKDIYAINGSTTLPNPLVLSPGDTVTYRLTYPLPSTETENLYFEDWLPLPVFDATELTTFDPTASADAPPAGTAKLGASDTFTAISGLEPVMTTNASQNQVTFDYGTHTGTRPQAATVELLFTVTVSNKPFADELLLTNQARSSESNSFSEIESSDAIVQFELGQPVLSLTKGVVNSNNSQTEYSGTPYPAGISFNPPGSDPAWTGGFTPDADTAPEIDSDASAVEVGDTMTFAIVLHNSGSSPSGAFDIEIQDDLPYGFIIPAGGLNLQARYADGTSIAFNGLGPSNDETDLFGNGIQLIDGTVGACQAHALEPGKSAIIITYDLRVDPGLPPSAEIPNTARLTNYSGAEGGENYVVNPIEDTATVTVVDMPTSKTITAPVHSSPQVTGHDFATIGEVYTVDFEVTVPQYASLYGNGTTAPYVEIVDTIAQNGADLCFAGDAPGCADPIISTTGGVTVTPDTTDAPDAPDWWSFDDAAIGSTISFYLDAVDNSTSSADSTFTITYTMLVNGENDAGGSTFFTPTSNDRLDDRIVLTYYDEATPDVNEFTTEPATATIAVDQPEMAATKNVVTVNRPGTGDLCTDAAACDSVTVQGNDVITYQSTFTNNGESTAMDVSIIDLLPLYVSLDSLTCSLSAPAVTGGVVNSVAASSPHSVDLTIDTTPAGEWDVAPGETITCDYSVTVNASVPTGTALQNDIDVDWSTLDGTVADERVFDDSPPDGSADSAADTISVQVPDATKVRTDPVGAAPDVKIGDVVSYRITIPLPIGTTSDLVITDILDAGLVYYEGGTFHAYSNSVDPLTVSETVVSGQEVQWAISDPACVETSTCIQNNGTDNTYVTVEFQAVVADVLASLDGSVLDNNMSATFNDGLGSSHTINDGGALDDEEVTVVEPHISTTKTVTPATSVDAGDTLSYSVTLTSDGSVTAYDVSFTDALDSSVTYDSGTLACELYDDSAGSTAPTTPTLDAGTFTVSGGADEASSVWDLDPGDTITCTYTVTANSDVVAGHSFDNTADADWTSQDGVVTGAANEPDERRYEDQDRDGSAPADDDALGFPGFSGTDDADSASATMPALTIDKTRTSPSVTVQPGDVATYEVVVTLPEGMVEGLIIRDALPTGFQFVSTDSVSTGWGASPALPGFSAEPSAGDSGTLSWVFNGVVEVPVSAADNTITLTYSIRATASASTGTATNTGAVWYTPEGGSSTQADTDMAIVSVIRPTMALTKTASVSTADAGDTVSYTVTISNSAAAPRTAYDVYFDENLSDHTDYVGGSLACSHSVSGVLTFEVDVNSGSGFDGTPDTPTSSMDRFRVAGDLTENDNPWVLAAGESIICTYSVTVLDTAPAGAAGTSRLTNTVTARFDTANGDQAGEQNISRSAVARVATPAPSIVKTRTSVDDTVQPGDLVSYEVVVTLPEGTTDSLVITDALPAGFEYVSGSVSDGWGGSPALPAFSDEPAAGDTTPLRWAFNADVINPGDNDTGNNTITFTYTVRVMGTATGTTTPLGNGDDAVNTAAVSYVPPGGSTTTADTDAAAVDVIRPGLTVTKTSSPAAPALVDAGDTITYSVVVENDGPGIAYDVSFEDVLDGETAYSAGSLACTFYDASADTTSPTSFEQSAPFTVAGGVAEASNTWDLDIGDNITCTYDVVVAQDVPASDAIANAVTAHADTSDGDVTGEDDMTATDAVTLNTPAASFAKSAAGDGTFAPGETVTYTLAVSAPEGSLDDLVICEDLPVGMVYSGTASVSNSDGVTYAEGTGYTIAAGAAIPAICPPDADFAYVFASPLVLDDNPNVDNSTAAGDFKTITAVYTTYVDDTVSDGDTLTNTATLTYTRGSDGVQVIGVNESVSAEVVTQSTDKVITTINRGGTDVCTDAASCNGMLVFATDILTYRLTLTNTHSTAAAYDVTLSDDIPAGLSYNGDLTCELVSPDSALSVAAPASGTDPLVIDDSVIGAVNLAPIQMLRCGYTATVQAAVSAGDVLQNTVTGTVTTQPGTPAGEAAITDTASDSASVANPEITLDKTPDSQIVRLGTDVTFTLTATNTGDVPLSSISVTDAQCDAAPAYQSGDDGSDGIMQPAEAWVYTCSVADIQTAFTSNTGQASGTPEVGPAVTDEDTVSVTVIDPSISITKTPSTTDPITAGTDVTFTLVVENTGDAPLSSITVTDDTCDAAPAYQSGDDGDSIMQPTETWTYTCSVTNIQADFTNTAEATGTPQAGADVTDSDSASVDVLPSFTVTKTVDDADSPGSPAATLHLEEPGGSVLFNVAVENTSQESITLTVLTDDVYGDLTAVSGSTCSLPQTIAAGAAYDCGFTVAFDEEQGFSETDTISATAHDDENNDVTETDSAMVIIDDVIPAPVVTKTASPTSLLEPGGDVTFTVLVENNQTEAFDLVGLTDDQHGDLDGQGTCSMPQTIAAGGSYSCAFTITFSGIDAPFSETDVVTATVEDNDGNTGITETDDAVVTVTDAPPTLNVTKAASPTMVNEPGGDVTFTITVENTSGEPATLTALSDSAFGNVADSGNASLISTTCVVPQAIAPSDTYSCTFTARVEGDGTTDHQNTITATVQDDEGNNASDTDSATVAIVDMVEVSKTADTGSIDEPGEPVTFNVEVSNPSTTDAITLTALNDDVFGDLTALSDTTCTTGVSIAPGSSYQCHFTEMVTGEGGDTHTNTISATVEIPGGDTVTDSDSVLIPVNDILPSITVSKTPNRGSLPVSGGDVTFTIVVTNTSTEDVTLGSLTDDVFGDLNGQGSCATGGTITVGGSYTCAFTRTLDIAGGNPHQDTVTASASDNDGNTISAGDAATVTFINTGVPSIDVTKTASPTTLADPGGDVTYTVTVNNTSTVDATLTSLTDDVFGDLNGQGSCATGGTITAGGSYTCSFTQALTGTTGDTHVNIVTAEVTDGTTTAADADSETVTFSDTPVPSIDVTKTASPNALAEPGGDVTYTVTVSNTSALDLTLTSLTDDVFGDLNGKGSCATGGTIMAGGTTNCSFTEALTGYEPGETHVNTVTAQASDGTTPVSASDGAVVTITDVPPTLTVSKAPSVGSIAEPGGEVTYTIVVTNTSGEAITITNLSDDQAPGLGSCVTGAVIAVDGTYTCSFTYTVMGNGGDTHANTFEVTAEDNDGTPATESDTASVAITNVASTITVDKTANRSTVNEPGGEVTYTITVTNNAAEPLTLNSLSDNLYGDSSTWAVTTCSLPQTLASSGDSYTCTFTETVSGATGTTHTNVITAEAHDDEGTVARDTDSASVLIADTLTVVKSPSPGSVAESGADVTFTLTVTNNGSIPFTIDSLVDDQFGDLNGTGTCAAGGTVAAGASYSCTFTRFIGGDASTHTNTITVDVTDDNGDSAEDADSADVVITDIAPTIEVYKDADPTSLSEPGGDAAFTVTVHNASTEEVTLTSLTDDVFGDLNGVGTCATGGTIAAGGDYTCTFTEALTGDAGDTHTDTVSAEARDDEDNPATDSDSAVVTFTDVAPTLTVSKAADPASVPEPGGDVEFTVTVTNTSEEDVTLTALVDDVFGDLNGVGTCATGGTIAVGGSYTCSFTEFIGGEPGTDDHTNIVEATVEDNESTTASENAAVTVPITDVAPTLSVTKSASPTSMPEPIGIATFTIEVTNTSFEDVTLTALVDSIYGNLNGGGTCSTGGLLTPGSTYTCSFNGIVIGDVGAPHVNVVSATVEDNDGTSISDADNATVNFTNVAPTITVYKSASQSQVNASGESVTYTISVRNNSDFESVTLVELTDDRFGNLDGAGNCNTPVNIPPGATYQCAFSRSISGEGGTDHVNTVTARAEDGDGSSASDSDSASVRFVADDVRSCVSGVLFNDANRNGVQDAGEQGLPNTRLYLMVNGAPFTEARTDDNGAYRMDKVPVGPYTLRIDETTLPSGSPIYVTPGQAYQEIDVTAGDTCTRTDFGLVLLDPAVTKAASPDEANPGDPVTFTIRAVNNSGTAISNVVVNDPLNGYLEYLSATTTQGSYTHDPVTNVVSFALGTIQPGQTVTMRVNTRIRLDAPRPFVVRNSAQMSSTEGGTETSLVAEVNIPGEGEVANPGYTGDGEADTGASYLPNTGYRPRPDAQDNPRSFWWGFGVALAALALLGLTGVLIKVEDQPWQKRGAALAVVVFVAGIVLAASFAPEPDSSIAEIAYDVSTAEPGSPEAPLPGLSEPVGHAPAAPMPSAGQQAGASEGGGHELPDDPATRLIIPRLSIDTTLVEAARKGNSWDVLSYYDEIAHLEGTPFPGTEGNAVVAGHVTHADGWGPFIALDKLELGDLVIAEGEHTSYVYRVEWTDVVAPSEIGVTGVSEDSVLTLITCADWSSGDWAYTGRLVVRARLVETITS